MGDSAPLSAESLLMLRSEELDALFARSPAGPIPDGEAAGLASGEPGTGWGDFTRDFFHGLWQGKVFDRAGGTLRNRTALGATADAKVSIGPSLHDGKPAIIIDYRESGNLLARGVYDEIREVAPGLYLGIAYVKFPPLIGPRTKWLYFALEFGAPSGA